MLELKLRPPERLGTAPRKAANDILQRPRHQIQRTRARIRAKWTRKIAV